MSSYGLVEIARRWGDGRLEVEQVIGQLLQEVQTLSERVTELERKETRKNGDSAQR